MMIVAKSPNMMSQIGRRPAIAAPTHRPLKPASEIGVSMMRSLPNSSTRPVSTLNVVPASATSSPMRTTRGSRRISCAIASLIASPKVSSRTEVAVSSINVLRHPRGVGIGGCDAPLHRGVHLFDEAFLNLVQFGARGDLVVHHPLAVQRDRIFFSHPLLLFRLRPVIGAGDVPDMMAVIPVRDALEERRALPLARAIDELEGRRVHLADVLAVDRLVHHAERFGALVYFCCGHLREVRVFVVAVVLAHEDDGELPELREVQLFIKQPL